MNVATVILPTYNERENVEPLIKALLEHVAAPIEVLVVDDDSPDGTWQIVQEMASRDHRVRLLHRTTERGLTSAIWAGIRAARGEIIAWMDCDFSHPPEIMGQLVAAVRDGRCDIAIGSRYAPGGRDRGRSWVGQAFSRMINLLAWSLLDRQVTDYTTGFVAAHRRIFEMITLYGDYGEYCIDFLYRALQHGFQIMEIPFDCAPREAGESKTAVNPWGYVRRGWKYVMTVVRLRAGRYNRLP